MKNPKTAYLIKTIVHLMAVLFFLVSAIAAITAINIRADFTANAAGTSGIEIGDHVYMGISDADGYSGLPYWRVIDKDADGNLFLMSEYLWLGDGSDPDAMIQFNPQAFHYEWSESNAKVWCKNFETAVLGGVHGVTVIPMTVSDERYESPDFDNIVYQARENILNGDKVFFLSAEETARYMPTVEDRVAHLHDGSCLGDTESWWLRSPRWLSELSSVTCAGRVFSEGRIGKNEVYQYSAMRPSMWVSLSPEAAITECVHGNVSTWVVDPASDQQTFTKPRYKWSSDNSACTAEATCKRCGLVLTEKATATSAVTKEATATETGVLTYTAKFADSLFTVQTKKLLIPKKDASAEEKPAAEDTAAKAAAEARARTVKTVTLNVATVNARAVDKAVKEKGGSEKYVTKIVLGKRVKKISREAFAKYKKVTVLEIKTKKLKKKTVNKSLKRSQIKSIKVKVGSKKLNKEYVKKYKKYFTKKNAGKKVTIK